MELPEDGEVEDGETEDVDTADGEMLNDTIERKDDES